MWQLETDATNASSGSTSAGFEYGTGTTDGGGEAATVLPPSNCQVCSREYLPLRKSGLVSFQLMLALCSDMRVNYLSFNTKWKCKTCPASNRSSGYEIVESLNRET